MSEDARWPRASNWISRDAGQGVVDLAILGMPAQETSLSKTSAATTPSAIREALSRYSTWATSSQSDLTALKAVDHGDAVSPDRDEAATAEHFARVVSGSRLAFALGGDNSISFAAAVGCASGAGIQLSELGLISLDAHHDFREGRNNGSWLRRLIEAGLKPENVVQIGIADFSNSASYSRELAELGVGVTSRAEIRERGVAATVDAALSRIPSNVIHVDFDMDVCDRSVVPGCPAAAPGGISADELRQFASLLGSSPRVRTADITEVDAASDSSDQRTVRLAALVILEMTRGLALRGTQD